MAEAWREPLELRPSDDGATLFRWRSWEEKFPWLSAGFSSRRGGVSGEPWGSLNCGLHVGDNDDDVAENRRRVAEAAGFDFRRWTCAEQVHGVAVAVVAEAEAGAGRLVRDDALPSKDALVTDVPGVMLNAFYADCVPIWFVDPVRRAVGVAHAGWRGAVADVAGETVRAMTRAYGSEPSELLAAIGPSIRGCCYEVDDQVAKHIPEGSESIKPSASPGRYLLDLAIFNRQKLTEAGILANHIEITQYCTSCRTDLFFSHRKENGRTGRMTAWIARKE
ncbi:peptidoglycan editing factor PgeF [Paenibacillus antri]|uniref:Purine nucleoside phosphorylase n=1 Tax=Paenibacillus antri TaxID=2582848 RepID=A0A5R9G239_9BACL|nr:peptidoglycan editing factor PgeF [Paenibacillus antri]TLS50412.1 peptidoglycan editing factor PgeF [Paenibacillus antri]